MGWVVFGMGWWMGGVKLDAAVLGAAKSSADEQLWSASLCHYLPLGPRRPEAPTQPASHQRPALAISDSTRAWKPVEDPRSSINI